jgi:hypothetical protein
MIEEQLPLRDRRPDRDTDRDVHPFDSGWRGGVAMSAGQRLRGPVVARIAFRGSEGGPGRFTRQHVALRTIDGGMARVAGNVRMAQTAVDVAVRVVEKADGPGQ